MSKYLDMIADIGDDSESRYEINELHEINPQAKARPSSHERNEINDRDDQRVPSPRDVLAGARYGSLTFGGLRDHLIVKVGCTTTEAVRAIKLDEDRGLIARDGDGLYRVVH